MTTPARASDHCTSPEQSNTFGPLPPHTYGSPSLLSAAVRNAITSARLSPGPSAEPTPAAPAAPAPAMPAPAVPVAGAAVEVAVWATSGAIAAPLGSSFSICFISGVPPACGALITLALPAGVPQGAGPGAGTDAAHPAESTL